MIDAVRRYDITLASGLRMRMTGRLRDSPRALRTYVSSVVPPRAVVATLRRYPSYFRARRAFQALDRAHPLQVGDDLPVLGEDTPTTPFDSHYTYLDGWAARRIATVRPAAHIDVGSRLSFSMGLSAFVPVTFIDRRPVDVTLDGFRSMAGDLLDLPYPDRSVESVSCLHVIEHVGLGRYGDALDPYGVERAASELQRILAPGGMLLLGVPIGRSRVRFNAHRILDPMAVVALFAELRLVTFAAVDDCGVFVEGANPWAYANAKYACGCYQFTRPTT